MQCLANLSPVFSIFEVTARKLQTVTSKAATAAANPCNFSVAARQLSPDGPLAADDSMQLLGSYPAATAASTSCNCSNAEDQSLPPDSPPDDGPELLTCAHRGR